MNDPDLDFDSLDLELLRARRGVKWSKHPDDVLPAWIADMDLPVAEPVRRAVARALHSDDFGYPPQPAPGPLPELFAARAAERFGWSVDARRVETITDVLQGLYVAVETYTEPGDGMVIFTPIYPPFLRIPPDTRRRAVYHTLHAGRGGYRIDFDALRACIDPRTRLLLWCNPHNPTGRVFTRAELESLAEVVLAHDLVVLSDEIHADLVYDGRAHIPFASLGPELAERTVTFTSATKAFNTAGLRCAIAVFGSERLHRRFNTIPRRLRGGASSLGLYATQAAWEEGQPWLDAALAYLQANRDFVTAYLHREIPGIGHAAPEATFLAWLDCRALRLEPEPYGFFLERAKVALSDGREFGDGGAGHVRVNFATARPLLEELLERMAAALDGGR